MRLSNFSMAVFAFEKYIPAFCGSTSDIFAAMTFNHTFAIFGDNHACGSWAPWSWPSCPSWLAWSWWPPSGSCAVGSISVPEASLRKCSSVSNSKGICSVKKVYFPLCSILILKTVLFLVLSNLRENDFSCATSCSLCFFVSNELDSKSPSAFSSTASISEALRITIFIAGSA